MFPGFPLYNLVETDKLHISDIGDSKVLVAVAAPVDESHLDFINKILDAIHQKLGRVVVANKETGFSISSLRTNEKLVLNFGLSPADIGLFAQISLNEPVTLNGRTYICTAHPEQLQNDTVGKRLLWNALKQVQI